MTRSFFAILLSLSGALVCGAPALAQTTSSGAAITSALAGNTLRGSLVASGAFEEFYSPDGQVRGPDYKGTWQVKGNQLCLSYDGDPPNCWALQINGNSVIWIGKGGEEGSGTLTPGNPKGF